jgi:glycerol-3-phosphate acyltransferase PlsY
MDALALIFGYLLGSIPTAHLIAMAKTGGDTHALGTGNVGGLNTIRQVGMSAGLAVIAIDIGKGALTVILAYYALKVDIIFVLGAGVMAVVGHNWMIWLGFRGGRGMAATVGVLAASTLIYGYGWILLIFIGIILIVGLISRNLVLGNTVALFALPVIVYFATKSNLATWMALVTLAVIVIKFAPAAIADMQQRGLKGLGPDKVKAKKMMAKNDSQNTH